MKTLKELADIGAAAAYFNLKRFHTIYVDNSREHYPEDEPARQAFAQAVRDAVLADLVTKPDSSPEKEEQPYVQAALNGIIEYATKVMNMSTKPDSSPTFEAHGFTWFKHKPGDPMPCDGDAEIVYIMRDHDICSDSARALRWTAARKDESRDADIIGWRYADKPTAKTVPLDINDIRATDEFQPCGDAHQLCTLRHANENGLSLFMLNGMYNLTYDTLATNYLRRQHGSNEWKPCTKEISANQH